MAKNVGNVKTFRYLCDIGECHAGIHQLSRIKRRGLVGYVCKRRGGGPQSYSKAPLFIPLVGEYIPSHLFMALEPSALANPPPSLPTPKCSTTGGPSAHSTAKATHINTLLYIFFCAGWAQSMILPITHSAYIFLPSLAGLIQPIFYLLKEGRRGGDGEKWRVVGSSSPFPSPAIQPRYMFYAKPLYCPKFPK